MFNKFDLIGAGVCVALMAAAIFLIQSRTIMEEMAQPAAVITSGATVVRENTQQSPATLTRNVTTNETSQTMKIDDIKIGTGEAAKEGDVVAVHYVGRLDSGMEFDNSHKRGAPIEFELGAGQVIPGWEEGIAGMQVGGERVLVIPPDMAYGDAGIGPIPGGATLTFTVELVAIK